MMMFGSCSDFLDQEPDTILTQDQTYGDEALMKSVLAKFLWSCNVWSEN